MVIKLADINDLSRSHGCAIDALNFAINRLETALAVSRYSFSGVTRPYLEMRRDMPYAIHETSIPGTQVLVNRNYKPLGSNIETGGEHLRYEDFTNLHVHLTKGQVASVANRGEEVYLFGDENSPWNSRAAAKAYLKRLVMLRGLLETSTV
jgi:hypothetical protein